ncbi:unnamed protein product [Brugia timori]|uniref:Uncharacterized protein n=1 Tax=Brugia timori TaxID=42155 RepID=A0A0R3RC83_9BILA|nr:unnamed protein product [Brugia timori]
MIESSDQQSSDRAIECRVIFLRRNPCDGQHITLGRIVLCIESLVRTRRFFWKNQLRTVICITLYQRIFSNLCLTI